MRLSWSWSHNSQELELSSTSQIPWFWPLRRPPKGHSKMIDLPLSPFHFHFFVQRLLSRATTSDAHKAIQLCLFLSPERKMRAREWKRCRALRRKEKGDGSDSSWRVRWQEADQANTGGLRSNSDALGDDHDFVGGPPVWLDFLQQCLAAWVLKHRRLDWSRNGVSLRVWWKNQG